MRFKTDIVHKIEWITRYNPCYKCNHAVGTLNENQINFITNFFGKRVTCKNCKRKSQAVEK
jgi:hypothetical protein